MFNTIWKNIIIVIFNIRPLLRIVSETFLLTIYYYNIMYGDDDANIAREYKHNK